ACEPLLLEPFAIEEARLVLGSAVAQHGNDRMSSAEPPGDAHRGGDVDAAGAAEQQAVLVQQPVDPANGFRILDVHGVVDGRVLKIRRHAADADALRDRARPVRLERAVADVFIQAAARSEEHTSELQSHLNLVCRLQLEKKKKVSQDKRIYVPYI